MNCYCCGKPLAEPSEHGWHKRCIKRFFGTTRLPEIDLSNESLQAIAIESTNKGYTVPGVQKKLSLHLNQENTPRLTLVNYPSGYILKPQSEEYPALPELEYLSMAMAKQTGIRTVPFALLQVGDQLAYITRRIDRLLPQGEKLAMEDFCQLARRLTEDKYRSSYERCGKIVCQYSENPGLDLSELFLRVVFSFAIGNSDMHLKNFSLIETAPGSAQYVLTDAYDLLSANLVLPQDLDQLALTVNGKNRNLRPNDFYKFADNCGIAHTIAARLINLVLSKEQTYLTMCANSWLPEEMKNAFCALIQSRMSVLRGNS